MIIKSVNFSEEICISTGNFETKKVRVELGADITPGENYDLAYAELKKCVESKLNQEYANTKGNTSSNAQNDYDLPSPPTYKEVTADINPTDSTLDIKCPKCGAPMVLKQGKTGQFWGCSEYFKTKCNGIVNINQVKDYLTTGTLTKNYRKRSW